MVSTKVSVRPVSSSIAVTTIRYPGTTSMRKSWEAVKTRVSGSTIAVPEVPSPHSIETVCVSAVPTSATRPISVADEVVASRSSSTRISTITGATFSTTTLALALPVPRSSSATPAVIV